MRIDGAATSDRFQSPENVNQKTSRLAKEEKVEGMLVDQKKAGQFDQKEQVDNLKDAVNKINRTMETYNTELRFSVHEDSGETMVKVINTKDDTVIRQIPPEYILDIVAHVKQMDGPFLSHQIPGMPVYVTVSELMMVLFALPGVYTRENSLELKEIVYHITGRTVERRH